MIGRVGSPEWVEVTGHGSQRRLSILTQFSLRPGYDSDPIAGTTQQSGVADALTETGQLWTNAITNVSTGRHGSLFQQQDAVHTIKSGYYQPYTVASCAADVIHGPNDDTAVAFPVPPGVQPNLMLNKTEYNESILNLFSFVYPGITKDELLGTPGSLEGSRLKWVELPQDPFNGSAIGAVILLPRSPENSSQELIVCNLGAGWGSSLTNTSSFAGGTTFTTSTVDWAALFQHLSLVNQSLYDYITPTAESLDVSGLTYFSLPLYPEKPITVTEAWANYLNPFVPALNTTVIDTLMSTPKPVRELKSEDQIGIAKWTLAGLLANGLASIGATSTLQGDIKTVVKPDGSSEIDGNYWFSGKGDMFAVDPEESKDWVKLRVDSTINGYAYNIRGAAPKVAISFLLVYCTIALSHVLYAVISGESAFRVIALNIAD